MEWISINDEMPPKGEYVIGFLDQELERRLAICHFDLHFWWEYGTADSWNREDITHWMKQPLPPK